MPDEIPADLDETPRDMDDVPPDISAEPDTGSHEAAPDTARLRAAQRRLSLAEAQLRRAEARLASLENSTALRVGQILANAARSPARRVPTLPRDLYRLWRRRSVRTSAPSAGRGSGPAVYEEERLLVGGATRGRPLVAGVLTGPAADALAGSADVLALQPHNAGQILGHTQPDLIIVQSAATTEGPWFGLGDAAAVDLEARLSDAVRGTGPRMLLAGPGCPPALRRLGWDRVIDGDLGVDLRVFHPMADGPRAAGPVLAWPADLRAPLAAQRLRTELLTALRDPATADAPSPADRAAVLRGHRTVIAGTTAAVVEALACGAWVVAPEFAVPEDLRPHVIVAADAEQIVKQAVALDADRPYAEVRTALRGVFARHATPARLAALLTEAGAPEAAADALAPRGVTVLNRQSRVEPAGTTWIAYEDAADADDLLCAAEYAGADAVGYADAAAPAYAESITPLLARRELAASGDPADTWLTRHGARLLTIPRP